MDWYCTRSKKQGHRIQVETPSLKLLLKFDKEEDSFVWYETLVTTVSEYKSWIENHHPEQSPTHGAISGPFNVTKSSSDELFQLLTSTSKEENIIQNKKLGRKGKCSPPCSAQSHCHCLSICPCFHFVSVN